MNFKAVYLKDGLKKQNIFFLSDVDNFVKGYEKCFLLIHNMT